MATPADPVVPVPGAAARPSSPPGSPAPLTNETPPAARPPGPGRQGPGRQWRSWPPALKASVAFGLVGLIVLLAGAISGSTPVLVVATSAGSASLIAALVWRAQLIEAWRKEKGRPTHQW